MVQLYALDLQPLLAGGWEDLMPQLSRWRQKKVMSPVPRRGPRPVRRSRLAPGLRPDRGRYPPGSAGHSAPARRQAGAGARGRALFPGPRRSLGRLRPGRYAGGRGRGAAPLYHGHGPAVLRPGRGGPGGGPCPSRPGPTPCSGCGPPRRPLPRPWARACPWASAPSRSGSGRTART